MYQEIAARIHDAANRKNKIAMFHFQVLKHAKKLSAVDPVEFCRLVKVRDSFATEFRKLLSLARLMEQEGVSLN